MLKAGARQISKIIKLLLLKMRSFSCYCEISSKLKFKGLPIEKKPCGTTIDLFKPQLEKIVTKTLLNLQVLMPGKEIILTNYEK